MGVLFTLNDSVKQVIQQALDDLLVDSSLGGLGKTCLLIYPPRLTPCSNCVIDPVSGRSSNFPRNGCGQPFLPGQACPLCGGKGTVETEMSESIVMGCNWEPKKFVTPLPMINVRLPFSYLETKFYLVDMPKVLKAAYLIFQVTEAPYGKQKFKLASEPGDRSNIIQNRYAYAVWERINA